MPISSFLLLNRKQINSFRLMLAIGVLISHSYTLGGYGPEPSLHLNNRAYTLGSVCVAFFFMLSGFLIQSSAQSKTSWYFWRARFLRIVPAYSVVLFCSSFILAPLLYYMLHGDLDSFHFMGSNSSLSYFFQNIIFPNYLQPGIQSIFITTPFGVQTGIDSLNGSLWTLPLEVRCYILIFFVSKFSFRFRGLLYFSFISVVFVILSFKLKLNFGLDEKLEWAICLIFFFLLGAMISHLNLKCLYFLKTSSLFFVFGLLFKTETRILLILPFVLAILLALIVRLDFSYYRSDLSFGFYIWAWPITQSTVLLLPVKLSHAVFICLISLGTFLASLFSWHLIEQPSIQKNRKIEH